MNKRLEEVDFLNYINKEVEKNITGINSIIEKVDDINFEILLNNCIDDLKNIDKETENILKKYGKLSKEKANIQKISTTIMNEISLITDKSVNNIAKLMIEHINKSIIDIIEKINKYDNEDEEIVILSNKYKDLLDSYVEKIKVYL